MGWSGQHRRGQPLVEAWRRQAEPLGGPRLVRALADLGGREAGRDVLCVACGAGALLLRLAVAGPGEATGVDPDSKLVEEAEARIRAAGLQGQVTVQPSPLEELPYRDGTFGFVVGEIGLAQADDPTRAVAELVRVAQPGARVALLALVWTGHVPPRWRASLVQRLGARPRLLVEWKQDLREAGAVDVQAEDWTTVLTSPSPRAPGLFSLHRWWASWRVARLDRLVFVERVVGLALLHGERWRRGESR